MTDPDIAALAYETYRKLLDQGWGILIFKDAKLLTAGAGASPPPIEALSEPAPATEHILWCPWQSNPGHTGLACGCPCHAGKAVGGNLSAAPVGAGDAKAPPPADGPGISVTPIQSTATAPAHYVSVDEARAALEAAQDREDAARGSNVLTALQQGKLGSAAVKALGAKWPMPRGATFGSRDSSLIARLQKAGTIAVGRWCRTHDIKEGE